LERLPTAYGLVRNGVAPDHPEVKNVQHDFDEALFSPHDDDDDNDISPKNNIQFYGNVQVGNDVSLQELRQRYDVVILAYGCESDRSLTIPGGGGGAKDDADALEGILSAREFVNWYNGHVDFAWVGPVVQKALQKKKKKTANHHKKNNIVVIGHGNVALDCARILAKTKSELDPTDIATRALDILEEEEDTPRRISIVGRRGHVQGAFTIKEVRELTKLPNAEFVVRSKELEMGKSTEASLHELKDSRPKTRIDKLLTDTASKSSSSTYTDDDDDGATQVHLRFLMNPIRFESSADDSNSLGRVVCERTQLVGETGKQSAQGMGVEEALEADLVSRDLVPMRLFCSSNPLTMVLIHCRPSSVLDTRGWPSQAPNLGLMSHWVF
jgi:adrenodoxin-NADP+ reductase